MFVKKDELLLRIEKAPSVELWSSSYGISIPLTKQQLETILEQSPERHKISILIDNTIQLRGAVVPRKQKAGETIKDKLIEFIGRDEFMEHKRILTNFWRYGNAEKLGQWLYELEEEGLIKRFSGANNIILYEKVSNAPSKT